MSETVFILGAGASEHAGAPLMLQFLDVADKLRRMKVVKDGEVGSAFDLVLDARVALDPVFAKAWIDTDNLEAVFGAFEMAGLLGRLGSMEDPAQIKTLQNAMRIVIVETLEQTVTYPIHGGSPIPSNSYSDFADLVYKICDHQQSVSIITFNYDVALDYALHHRNLVINYCLDPNLQQPSSVFRVDLMKLHGSVNWTTCARPDCGVVPYEFSEFLAANEFSRLVVTPDGTDPYEVARLGFREPLRRWKHKCADPAMIGLPVIVPPTWNKASGHREIEVVWRRAMQHLAEARNIIVIGYSLPESDQFFRYLYALGTVSRTRLEKVRLLDMHREPGERFQEFLGKGAERRFRKWPNAPFNKNTINWMDALLFKGTDPS